MRAIALVLLTACAENAVLEIQLTHPPAPADDTGIPWYALVGVRAGDGDVSTDYRGSGGVSGTLLDTADFTTDCISVNTRDPDQELDVVVEYCRNAACTHPLDPARPPSRAFHIDTPFYRGQRTFFTQLIDRIPACTSDADCAVGQCTAEGICGCASAEDCCPPEGCRCPEPPCFSCSGGSCLDDVYYCRVGGCIENDGDDFCTSDGAHFCTTGNAYDEAPGSYTGCSP